MCGIIGILGNDAVAMPLVDALKRLEYRGYDSAGVATVSAGRLDRRRAVGKLRNLEDVLRTNDLGGTLGIGHTRWATHGQPTEANAHPHAGIGVAVVHNGIIENFRELREELTARGRIFESETDTETIAHLVAEALADGLEPLEAVQRSVKHLRGAFALAFVFDGHDDLIVGARLGSPLAVGYGEGEMFLGSDAIALAPFTDKLTYLEDGDTVALTRAGARIFDANDRPMQRPVQRSNATAYVVDKGNFHHFMMKEIHEQPEVVSHTLTSLLDMASETVRLPPSLAFDWSKLTRVTITACGTAYYAGCVAKYWFERFARLPVEIDVASEFRYREAPMPKDGLAIFVSQSGETADTLAALRYCKAQGQHTLSVVNVPTSNIARESEAVVQTLAGPEIGVASTKAFLCQLAALITLAIGAGKARGHIDAAEERRLVRSLVEVPRLISEALHLDHQIEQLARTLARAKDVLYLGRGTSYPMALEGALKLKEISYLHAEGYAAGELKHGPIALIDETLPVIVIAPFDHVFEKTVSNMQEVMARGGKIILITDKEGAAAADVPTLATLVLPTVPAAITPLIYAVPIQLLAYRTAVHMGTDVDQPRNLAKSVTVE